MNARHSLFFVAVLFLAPAISAQQSSPPKQSGDSSIELNVVVTHKSGPPISGLKEQDFTILDNKTPRTITSFQAVDGSKAPIEVMLVLDTVNAPYSVIAYERGQVDKFLRSDEGDLDRSTSFAVLTDTGVKSPESFSKDGNKLSAALDQSSVSLRVLTRSAGFYGAAERFQISLQALRAMVKREEGFPGRKIIVWISPGWPLLSGPAVQLDEKERQQLFADIVNLSTMLRQERVTLYSIDPVGTRGSVGNETYWQNFVKGISKPGQAQAGNLALQVLVTQSGGVVVEGNNDITSLLQRCLSDTRQYYQIAFDAPAGEQPNQYHHVEVRVAQHGLTARTLQGYYSQAQSGSPLVIPTPVNSGDPRMR